MIGAIRRLRIRALLPLIAGIPLATYGHDSEQHDDSAPADPPSDYVTKLEEMTAIEAGKGEKDPSLARQ